MIMKKRILIDMDGVLADVYKSLIDYQYTQKGIIKTEYELNGLEERTAFPDIVTILKTPGFFLNLPLMEDCRDGLAYLNEKYEIVIVSSATEFDNCLNDKHNWLKNNFPFLHWSQIIHCGSKKGITGDIMIDDHPKNLDYFSGQRIIFTQPHNYDIHKEEYTRVKSWNDIMKLL